MGVVESNGNVKCGKKLGCVQFLQKICYYLGEQYREEKGWMECYEVKAVHEPVDIIVEVPGSKSITNRALLMAIMADGESVLNGVLFSDDSEYFLGALEELGFGIEIDREKKQVKVLGKGGDIPKKEANI